MADKKGDSSRTIELPKHGMNVLLILAAGVLVALVMGVRGEDLRAVSDVLGVLGMSVAALAGSGSLSHGARHWGAKQPGGLKSGP